MFIPLNSLFILICAALFTSIISAMTGLGGGTLLLGIILLLVDTPYVVPLHAAIQLISNSTRFMLFFKHIRWKIILLFIIGVLPGAFAGIYLFKHLDKGLVKLMMGFFILLITFLPKMKKVSNPKFFIFIPVGFISGLIGIFFGAIGPFIAPFFLRRDVIKEELVATKAACQSFTHVVKIVLFGFVGINILAHWDVLIYLAVAVIVGTVIGKRFLVKISDQTFKIIFKVILVIIAFRIILKQLIL